MEISVIVTNYNYGRYLSRCIRSLANQSFSKDEFEIIVIDDASTDDSKRYMDIHSDVVKPIYNAKNLGLAASCNKAIRQAMGKFIIRVDADDFVSRDTLKVHHLFLSHNKGDINATSSDYYEIDNSETVIRRRNGTTFPIACGVMFKLDDMLELGLYNENIPREDVDFRSRFLKSGRHIYNIPIPFYKYTQHSESMTKSGI